MPQSTLNDLLPGVEFSIPPVTGLTDERFIKKNVFVDMLRLDEIHPVISGNKLFKLTYYLKDALASPEKTVVTFGGAYSNHLAATAFACHKTNLKCIGYIRGEQPAKLSSTLLFCEQHGMELRFLSRSQYKEITDNNSNCELPFLPKHAIIIPEGGYSERGVKGAALIPGFFDDREYNTICVAIGTATTFAGLISGCQNNERVIGFPVLKNLSDIGSRLAKLRINDSANFLVNNDYHFGGYARKNERLIAFINDFYNRQNIPLDFVYTAKMMFGVYDQVEKNFFKPGSRILCLHTGGLQGNLSLSEGVVNF
jgi:1-aminocyclopropane-1-carboxylate deaminase